jgi:hypothetical protein
MASETKQGRCSKCYRAAEKLTAGTRTFEHREPLRFCADCIAIVLAAWRRYFPRFTEQDAANELEARAMDPDGRSMPMGADLEPSVRSAGGGIELAHLTTDYGRGEN